VTLDCRVLLVDDEALLRRSAGRLLKSLGCTVDEAESGRVAVDKVRAGPESYDVVMMDLTMPDMDGTEAMRHLEAIAPSLPIIVSSGHSPTPVLASGRVFGLTKPYSVTALEAVIRDALSGRH
jgi:two-component system, cell cycle sensor histidine kinase and response regulator CckA